ncbi:MAG: hypothetical protein WA792_07505 [Pseudolabrys sp.]|jgi:hypothetical protein
MADDRHNPLPNETPAAIAGEGARAVLVASLMVAIIALIAIAGFKSH